MVYYMTHNFLGQSATKKSSLSAISAMIYDMIWAIEWIVDFQLKYDILCADWLSIFYMKNFLFECLALFVIMKWAVLKRQRPYI